MKEQKILIKIHKRISELISKADGASFEYITGLDVAKQIVEDEINKNKERKNIHHNDIQKSSKSSSKKKVHSL